MAAPGTDQWSDWEVGSLCIVGRLIEAVTKEGVTHPLFGAWRRARRAFETAAVDGRPAPRQRARLRTVTETVRQGFAEAYAEESEDWLRRQLEGLDGRA